MAQTGVSYPGSDLVNSPTIYQAPVTVGNAGGSLTVQSAAGFTGTTTISGPLNVTGGGTTTIGGVNASYALSGLGPADIGLKAWSFPNQFALGTPSAVTVAGSVYLSALHLTGGVTYGTIWLKVQANGGTATAGSCFAGIYNGAGALVATTADLSGALGTAAGTTGYISCPLATALTPSTGGNYWVGAFFNASAAGSFPALYCMSNFVTLATSAGTSATGIAAPNGTQPFPYAAVATTSGTAMPASFALGSAGTTGAYVYWSALA